MSGKPKRASIDDEIDSIIGGSDRAPSIDDEIDSALAAPPEPEVPPERQQPEDTSPNVVDNPQATVQAGMPEQGPPPAPNQQIEPQSPSWLTGLVDMYKSMGGRQATTAEEAGPSPAAAAAYTARMQGMVDNPGDTALRTVASLAAPVASPGGGVLAGLAGGAAQGALQSYADSSPDDQDRLLDALKSGGAGAALGGLGGLGYKAGTGAARAVEGAGARARGAAYGIDKDMIAQQAARMKTGDQDAALRALVARGEEMSPPNAVFGKSAQTYANDFSKGRDAINGGINQSLDDAAAAGAQLPPNLNASVAGELDKQAAAAGRTPGWRGAGALNQEAEAVRGFPNPQTAQDARALKMQYDGQAFGAQGGTPESYAELASKAAGDQYRGALTNFANQGGPDIGARYAAGNAAYPAAASLATAAGGRANQAAASGGWIPPVVGSAIGGAAGWMGGGPVGALAGAGAGAAAGRAGGGLAGAYGADVGANLAAPVAATFQGLGDAANWLTREAGVVGDNVSDIAQRLMGGPKPVGVQQQPDSNGPRSDASDVMDPQRTYDNSRGHLGYEQADKMFMDNKGNDTFQPWASDFAQIDIDNKDAFQAKWEKLLRTDPAFDERVTMLRNQGMG